MADLPTHDERGYEATPDAWIDLRPPPAVACAVAGGPADLQARPWHFSFCLWIRASVRACSSGGTASGMTAAAAQCMRFRWRWPAREAWATAAPPSDLQRRE